MKNIFFAFLLIGGITLIQSCYYDNPPVPIPFDCEDVSFSTHITPILENSCATSGCHDGTTEPDLSSDKAWNAIRSGGHINLLFPETSSLYETVEFINNPMPPGGPQIPELDRELILCWIIEGASNN